jgi:hypothetical protein
MSANGWLQFALFCLILLASVRPVGIYLARVLEGQRTWLDLVLRPIERLIYKLSGVDSTQEMNWREYAFALLGFSAAGLLVTYAIERLQAMLPLNPQGLAAVGPDLAWNTAASFTTNTNWQSYSPESTMSYLTQMAALSAASSAPVPPPSATSGSTPRAPCSISCCLHRFSTRWYWSDRAFRRTCTPTPRPIRWSNPRRSRPSRKVP